MLIPIDLSPSSTVNPKLPSCLAKISHDEVVLIELQGSLEVESNHPSERDGKHVGKLKIDETTVRCSKSTIFFFFFSSQNVSPKKKKITALTSLFYRIKVCPDVHLTFWNRTSLH